LTTVYCELQDVNSL